MIHGIKRPARIIRFVWATPAAVGSTAWLGVARGSAEKDGTRDFCVGARV